MLTHLLTPLLFIVHLSHQVCVEIPSETEAVLGQSMRLTCIDCMKREEVKVKTRVDWYYMPNASWSKTHIFKYEDDKEIKVNSTFSGRLLWNASQDLQDLSIWILNVTYSDQGIYECIVFREFEFDFYRPTTFRNKHIELNVIEKASEDPAALYSEIMMYVLLVFLTFWLLVEMVYCYRKISKSDEQAQDTATNYLAVPSEQKDTAAAPVTE